MSPASAGELSGSVVDADGHPVANATVHLVTSKSERTVTTELKFEPARNRADKPISSLVVWKFEWPPEVWNHGRSRIPPEASKLPCRRSTTDTWYALDTPYRDCAPPNMTAAISAPWIDRPKR